MMNTSVLEPEENSSSLCIELLNDLIITKIRKIFKPFDSSYGNNRRSCNVGMSAVQLLKMDRVALCKTVSRFVHGNYSNHGLLIGLMVHFRQ